MYLYSIHFQISKTSADIRQKVCLPWFYIPSPHLSVRHQLELQPRHEKTMSHLASQSFALTNFNFRNYKNMQFLKSRLLLDLLEKIRFDFDLSHVLSAPWRRATESCKILALDKRYHKNSMKLAVLVRSKATCRSACFPVAEGRKICSHQWEDKPYRDERRDSTE